MALYELFVHIISYSSDYWQINFDMVKEIAFLMRKYTCNEDDCTKQIDGFIGLNDDYIEGDFCKRNNSKSKRNWKTTSKINVKEFKSKLN